MKKLFTVFLLCSLASACSDNEPENLMSPCVGKSGSPCDRVPLNQQLLQKQNIKV